MLGAKKEAKFVEYRVNDAKLQKMLDLADHLIQPKTRQESRLQRYWKVWHGNTPIKKTWNPNHPRIRTAEAVRLSFAELDADLPLDFFQLAAGQPLGFNRSFR